METATARVGAHKDVQTLINEKVIELLDKGIAPWRKPWTGGIPRNLISFKPYRAINLVLLSCLGYERNIFVTEKQLKEIGASIKPGERSHMVAFWNYKDANGNKQAPQLRYYYVYNIEQCSNISEALLTGASMPMFDIEEGQKIVADMPHRPDMKSRDQQPYFDVLEDYINMPKEKSYKTKEEHFTALFHQMMHATGHHTRLDRMGLVQMAEYGYLDISQEDVIAELGTRYLNARTGIVGTCYTDDEYLQKCKSRIKSDRNFILGVSSLAQKGIDFILNYEPDSEEGTVTEE